MGKVALLKCKPNQIKEKVHKALDLLGGISEYVKKYDMVVIKPNVLCAQDHETGATTSPVLVKSVADMCLNAGAKKVIVAESSNWGIDSMEAMKECGYDKIADGEKIVLMDLKKGEFVKKDIDGLVLKSINIPKILCDADVVINCPVLKAHTMTKVTIGIKNLSVGISSDEDKQHSLHRIGLYPPLSDEMEKNGSWLDQAICDINSNTNTTLTVVDGIYGLHGKGAPLFGDKINTNLIMASDDRVSIDSVGSKILGHDAMEVHHIRNSYNRGMGEIDLDKIEVVGDKISDFKFDINQSYNTSLNGIPSNVTVINGCKNCKACLSTMTYVLSRHKDEIEKMNIPINVYVGKYFEDKKLPSDRRMHIYYGNCAGSHIYGGGFVPGCPPRSRRQFIQSIGALDIYKQDEGLDTDR